MRAMVVGTGFGQSHIEWLKELDVTIDVLAFCKNKSRAMECACRYGIPAITDNPVGAIRGGNIDLLIVVSPPFVHHVPLIAGLEQGMIVVSDKPLADSCRTSLVLTELAKKLKARAFVTFQWRSHSALRRLRKIISDDALGRIIGLDIEFHHDFLAGPSSQWEWRHQVTQAGAGALGDLGIHMLDLIAYLFPAKWRVTHARLSKAWFERTVEAGSVLCNTDDVAEVLLTDYASGADARVVVSRATVGLRLMRVVSRGTNGTAIISIDPTDGSGSTEVLFSNPADRHRQSLRPENMNPYLYLMQFLKVPGSAPPAELATFEQGHLAQLLMEDALCFSRN